ncbi:MBL fold metallo-hydrolase [Mesorhizobium sp.]|uniref:MBL fold metallo-hydrolase n=1 Tax=Mesorhizobium sp. TaxID=1871066 RepID=UPI0025FEC137|nr:MBL fold metallo-hydrolase [Mesorhizobium sp.]
MSTCRSGGCISREASPSATISPPQVPLFDGALRLSVNAFAIDDGHEITLIDTGSSNAWHPTMGLLPQALSEARIAVDRIRTVAFTHTHLDHIHGLIRADGRDGFPQLSRLLVPRAELDMFRSVARLSRFHDERNLWTLDSS